MNNETYECILDKQQYNHIISIVAYTSVTILICCSACLTRYFCCSNCKN